MSAREGRLDGLGRGLDPAGSLRATQSGARVLLSVGKNCYSLDRSV